MTDRTSLYDHVRDRQALLRAWRVICANAERSGNADTRKAAKLFDEKLFSNIENIQRRLRARTYKFSKAYGAAVRKGQGKPGKRAIVIASVQDRVVQRAILDTIYVHCASVAVLAVLKTPTSVGGVPKRGIGHALAVIEGAVEEGASYIIKSDIHNFFPSLPRANVLAFMREHIDDHDFVQLFEQAVTVELANLDALGSDSDLFPLGEDGVAQGSPLSVLAGNIVLREFDAALNGRRVTCVRYIDDFLLLAPSQRAAEKALSTGLKILTELKLKAYSPGDGSGKALAGSASAAYDFLGYKIVRGLNPPSENSCEKLIAKIDAEIQEGKKWINRRVKDDVPDVSVRQCYIQTLTQIDSILRGWAGAFQFSQSIQSLRALDNRVNRKINDFEIWFDAAIRNQPSHIQQRAMGIRLLSDTTPTALPLLDDALLPS
jgi:RNA-directed DNA polymerase